MDKLGVKTSKNNNKGIIHKRPTTISPTYPQGGEKTIKYSTPRKFKNPVGSVQPDSNSGNYPQFPRGTIVEYNRKKPMELQPIIIQIDTDALLSKLFAIGAVLAVVVIFGLACWLFAAIVKAMTGG